MKKFTQTFSEFVNENNSLNEAEIKSLAGHISKSAGKRFKLTTKFTEMLKTFLNTVDLAHERVSPKDKLLGDLATEFDVETRTLANFINNAVEAEL